MLTQILGERERPVPPELYQELRWYACYTYGRHEKRVAAQLLVREIESYLPLVSAQRTREIGIRAALGAQRRHILAGLFGRLVPQLALGVGVGTLLSAIVFVVAGVEPGRAAALLCIVAVIIAIVGLLAAVGPARRGLRIEPTEALREA